MQKRTESPLSKTEYDSDINSYGWEKPCQEILQPPDGRLTIHSLPKHSLTQIPQIKGSTSQDCPYFRCQSKVQVVTAPLNN